MAGGLGARLGVDPLIVRIGFVLLTVAGGSGLLVYVIGWLVLPTEPAGTTIAANALRNPRDTRQAIAVGLLVLGGLLLLRWLGLWFSDALVWPVALGAAGLAVIWRQADDEDRAALTHIAARLPIGGRDRGRRRRTTVLRIGVGVALVSAGVGGFLAATHAFDALRQGILAVVGVAGGVGLIFGPWWWRVGRELAEERRERVRSQERAEVAAHLHDSVLQTLALIQRQADDPRAVSQLARRQERELRAWLFDGSSPQPGTLGAAMQEMAAEVEARHRVPVEAVTVGDCPLDPDVEALVAAAREATVNAAKWSEADSIAVYAEVEPRQLSVFVRDRGHGFDRDQVDGDRKGITESIEGRMARHGGKAVVRSRPGEGTEVQLVLARPSR